MSDAPAPELLVTYGMRGPRYTSYPTAPQFKTSMDHEQVAATWRASTQDLSLYLHVPFCQVRCSFCGCHVKITRDRERSRDYVDRLLTELGTAGSLVDLSRPLHQVQLGGGTPNFLLPEQMRRLVEGLRARLRSAAGAEWAIECDPRALDFDYIDILFDLGFNRFSLGVQDLEPEVMKAVNRPQALRTVEEVVEHLRSRGPVSLNLDLIYGLPRQSEESWERTLAAIVQLRPTRLAVFGYAHVPWLMAHQTSLERFGLPDASLRARLATAARETFLSVGYVEIGMDHYALPDDELARARADGTLHRNFMGYTTRRGLDMVAIGTSAISKVGRSYTQDDKDLARWQSEVDAERMPWERGLLLSDDDLLRGDIITELSCNGALDIRAIEREHGIDFASYFATELEALRDFQADGLVELDASAMRLTPQGRYLVRNACMVFDAYLAREQSPATPRYSSTV